MEKNGKKNGSPETSGRGVLLGLSGGVDSAAAAILLKGQGCHVTAVTLRTWQEDGTDGPRVERAVNLARLLEIPHRVVDARQAFYEQVVLPFTEGWKRGLTPNPCVMCNPGFKFALMSELADELGIQYLATGHYARIFETAQGIRLGRAGCRRHDQSYFLYRLNSSMLRRILFPLGELSKEDARRLAGDLQGPLSEVRDSQDICFIEKNQLKAFLRRQGMEEKSGFFLDLAGEVIGEHKGSWQYTIGQRRHLGQSFGRRMTVLAADHLRNTVTLGGEDEALMKQVHLVDLVLADPRTDSFRAEVQLRSQGRPHGATVEAVPDAGEATVRFDMPVRITAPGQSAIFYDGDLVLGGGLVAGMTLE